MSEPILQVQNLQKSFRIPAPPTGRWAALQNIIRPRTTSFLAVDGVSFDVQPGEFVGYLGPNGAGKSTTIKCLTGVLVPDSGQVRACGLVPWQQRHAYTRRIGVVFGQKTLLIWDLPVQDSFRLYKDIYRVNDDDYALRLAELVERFNAAPLLRIPTRKLSLGQRMRCELIAALLHKPDILYLDEPTIGLDYQARQEFRQILRDMHAAWGMTVMFTSHDLTEVEALCERLLVIEKGKVSFDGSPATLRDKTGLLQEVTATFSEVLDPLELKNLRASYTTTSGSNWIKIQVANTRVPDVVASLMRCIQLTDLKIDTPPLDDVLAKWYRP